MSRIYDNKERLVGATLDREKLRELARAPSLISSSDFTSHEDDNISRRLRIADQEGRVRNIYFPVDIETDTSLSVATEMVAELDITDQDVTKIAEIIDSEIASLVPEWQRNFGIHESINHTNSNCCQNCALT